MDDRRINATRSLSTLAAALALGLTAAGVAPTASAGHVVIGIGLPGIAIAAPFPVFAPPYFYAPAYVAAPWYRGGYGYGYYGRPYWYGATRGHWRGDWHGYGGRHRDH